MKRKTVMALCIMATTASLCLPAAAAEPTAQIAVAAEVETQIDALKEGETSGECGERATWEIKSNGTLIIAGEGEIYDYGWEDAPWYQYADSIKTIEFADDIESIGSRAFAGLGKVTKLVLPANLIKIGEASFSGCTGLKEVSFSDALEELGYDAFKGCTGLESVVIPKSLKKANFYSDSQAPFMDCDNLKEASFQEGILVVPTGLFSGCTGLEKVTFAKSIEEIQEKAFQNASRLGTIVWPENLETIGKEAFVGCKKIVDLSLPEGIVKLEKGAFRGCVGIKELVLPGTLEELGYDAFKGCTGLESVVIPKSLKMAHFYTDSEAPFMECTNLKEASFEEGGIVVPTGLFSGCTGLEKVTFAKSIEEIQEKAFQNASRLSTIVWPENLETIGKEAFVGCKKIVDLSLPEGVVKLEEGAFRGCVGIKELVLPGTLEELGYDAFKGCTGLESVVIPKSLKKAHFYSDSQAPFFGCTALTNITFEEGTNTLIEGVLTNCTGFRELTLPKSIQFIEKNALKGCTRLKKLTLLGRVMTIDKEGFPSGMTIRSYKDTYAEEFAKENGYTFESLGDLPWDLRDNPFGDVKEGTWQYSPASYAYWNGMMKGKGNTADGMIKFDPNNNLTRAEFAQVLYNMENKPAVTYEACFSDVPDKQWYTNAIIWAKQNGIVAGKGDKFDVNGLISREEMATMFKKYAAFKNYDVEARTELDGYKDVSKISKWAVENLKWAIAKGVMKGKGENIDPTGKATRAECAAMLKNFCTAFEEN